MNPAFNNPRLIRPALGCLRCFPADDCPDDCRARNHDGRSNTANRRNCTKVQGAPFVVWFILAFAVFVAIPACHAVAASLRAERARERREIEAAARLKLLAEQQRLRQAAAQFRERKPGPNPNQGTRR